MQIQNNRQHARADLIAWAQETGRPLPLDIDAILRLEEHGHVVDLNSGRILLHAADRPLTRVLADAGIDPRPELLAGDTTLAA